MIYGWTGKILNIDLSRKSFEISDSDPEIYRSYMGGRGLGGYYLRSFAELAWDHPDMIVCIFTGPLTGTLAPTSGRAHIISKSPLTGLIADSSVGGRFALHLKRSGFDGIIFTGVADIPVGIEITDNHIEIKKAASLWGLDIDELHRKIRPSKASLAAIGPAAENGVKYASIMIDRSFAAGRTGLGLCLGNKKIKYILVKGTGKCRVKNRRNLIRARQDILRLTAASPILMGSSGFAALGTGAIYDLMDNRQMMPSDNFCRTKFEPASRLNAAAYHKKYSPEKKGCSGCHIFCKKTGIFKNRQSAMPEFETMSHFTALIGSADTDLVVKANETCNRFGMDTISAASALACRREILGNDYTQKSVLSLLRDIGLGRNEGKELGMGATEYADKMGRPETAMAVKGLDLAAYDPRGAYGMALGYAVATRGGCHLRAYPVSHEILRKPVATDRFSFSGKARIIKIAEDTNAIVDSLIACRFVFFAAGLEEYAAVCEAVTGIETSAQDLMAKGEMICYNERIINALNGIDSTHDDLPERFFTEPGSRGDHIQIPPLSREDFLKTRAKYYNIRGLDKNGRPCAAKARSLGLVWNT